jgi:ABC-type transport system substrate-binding protein
MDGSIGRSGRLRLPVIMGTIALLVAACGTSTAATPSAATGTKGGTLIMLGSGDVDHLDTASAYYTVSYQLERAYSRQLVSYPTSADQATQVSIVADVATQVPTISNHGISSDGKTYTFKIRSGVKWDTSPPRQVTAQDFVLGLKRLCNPVNPVGAPGYYESTIAGFKDYCEPMLNMSTSTAAAIANYINTHDISGVTTSGSDTLKINLTQAASDFLYIMALPFASAAPQEYLQYVPGDDTFNQHVISDGPYSITHYDPNKEIDLDRNPAWSASSDPLRAAYVDHIRVTEGLDANAVQQQLAAGTGDWAFDTSPQAADLAQALQSKDPRLQIGPPSTFSPYIVFNLQSPNAGGAVQKLAVRQAIEYAINKTAIAQLYGGLSINQIATQILAPADAGYQKFDLYPDNAGQGDTAKAQSVLQAAGLSNLTLKMVYRTSGRHPKVAQSIQADLAKIGITLTLVPVPPAQFYTKYLESADASKRGVWDIAGPGWVPDWFGNNGRAIIQPLFDGRTYGPGTTDYGDYNSDTVNSLIDRALAATSQTDANNLWHQTDMQIMQDAAVVPLLNQESPIFHSTRVQNFIDMDFWQNGDPTNVWLKS